MAKDNREYKDRLFCFLFGSEEHREWTLSLYNAVNGSAYTDPSEIEITTIKEVLYLGMHNDVSFLLRGDISLYEQQSSFNPNMPVRLLQYTGNLYEKYVTQNGLDKYGRKLLGLPVPRLVVFYNGTAEQPEEQILRLSDSFPEGADTDIEVTVRMLNINSGRNREILEACRPLAEYAWLIDRIRQEERVLSEEKAGRINLGRELPGSAIDRAITAMPDGFVIKGFLEVHRAEVRGMLLTEYDEVKQMELTHKNAYTDGREEGRKEGICGAVRILRGIGMSDTEIVSKLMNQYGLDRKTAQKYIRRVLGNNT